MNRPLSVSSLNEQIKNLLETTFVRVYVEGELSRITYHNSGHIYFTLKDAGSVISCVMFRGNASKLKFRLEEGLKILLEGAITLYKPRGSYQVNAFMIEPSGHGALALAYEQLKERLSKKGYFETSLKKVLPKFPKKIALITSATGAALQDMLRVTSSRWALVKLYVYDTVVQGANAAPSIVRSIEAADREDYDIIVIGRGGGSLEDLWAFNEESVANSIHSAKTPIVSAVGHEIDWMICDYVADLRAATPSAAMEILLPDRYEMLMHIDTLANQYDSTIEQKLYHHHETMKHIEASFKRHSIEQKIEIKLDEIKQYKERYIQSINYKLENERRVILPLVENIERQNDMNMHHKDSELKHMSQLLMAQDPKLKSKKGFVQITKGAQVIELKDIEEGDDIEMLDTAYSVEARVINKVKYR